MQPLLENGYILGRELENLLEEVLGHTFLVECHLKSINLPGTYLVLIQQLGCSDPKGEKTHSCFDCYSTYADAVAETSSGSELTGLEIQHFFSFST